MVPKIGLTGATRLGEDPPYDGVGAGLPASGRPAPAAQKARLTGRFFPVDIKGAWFDLRAFTRYNPRLFCGPIGRPRSCNNVCRDSHGR
jgi:hypothetical protein